MGSNKTTQQSSQNQVSQSFATLAEQNWLNTQQGTLNSLYPQQGQASGAALNTLTQGFNAFNGTGQAQGELGTLMAGQSPEVQQSMVNSAMENIMPSLGQTGALNSGGAANVAANTAANVYQGASQFNLQNLNNILGNLFSGNAATQGVVNNQNQLLSQSLAGLRQNTASGTYSGSTQSINPFLLNLEQSSGSAIGNGLGQGLVGGTGAVMNGGASSGGFTPAQMNQLVMALKQNNSPSLNMGNGFGGYNGQY